MKNKEKLMHEISIAEKLAEELRGVTIGTPANITRERLKACLSTLKNTIAPETMTDKMWLPVYTEEYRKEYQGGERW